MVQNIIGGLQGVVDHAMVGHFVGHAGNAAIGVSIQIWILVIVFISSVFTGMGVLVARFAGAGNHDAVNRTVYQAFLAAVIMAVGVMAPVGYFAAPWLLDLVNAVFAAEPAFAGFRTHRAHDATRQGRVEVLPLARNPAPASEAAIGGLRDPLRAAREVEERRGTHGALEVDVELDLRHRAHEGLEPRFVRGALGAQLSARSGRPSFCAIRDSTAGGTRPSRCPPRRKTSFTSRLER